MTYQELLILLPCHSLEDFPTYHEGEDAQGLLSAWSAMWQPLAQASLFEVALALVTARRLW